MIAIEAQNFYIAYVFKDDSRFQEIVSIMPANIKTLKLVDLDILGITDYPFYAVETVRGNFTYFKNKKDGMDFAKEIEGSMYLFDEDWNPSINNQNCDPWDDYMGILPHEHYE